MKKKIGLLTLHGRQEADYACDLFRRVRRRIGDHRAKDICFKAVYYQDLLETNQIEMLRRMCPYVEWGWLRRPIVHWLSDATSIESKKSVR